MCFEFCHQLLMEPPRIRGKRNKKVQFREKIYQFRIFEDSGINFKIILNKCFQKAINIFEINQFNIKISTKHKTGSKRAAAVLLHQTHCLICTCSYIVFSSKER